jgi:hypothetical protein
MFSADYLARRDARHWRGLSAHPRFSQKPQYIAAKDQCFVCRRQTQQSYFVKLQSWVQPRSIRSEQNFVCPRTPHGLNDIVESPDTRRIGINVGESHKLVDEALVGPPLIAETAKMRNYKIHISVFRREHVHKFRSTSDIHEQRHAKDSRHFTDLARGHRFQAMHLNASKIPMFHGSLDHCENPPRVARRVNEGKPNQATGVIRNDAGELGVRFRIVRMKHSEHYCPVDPCSSSPPQIRGKRRFGRPRRRHRVTDAGVAMTINDQDKFSETLHVYIVRTASSTSCCLRCLPRLWLAPNSVRNQIEVAMPL